MDRTLEAAVSTGTELPQMNNTPVRPLKSLIEQQLTQPQHNSIDSLSLLSYLSPIYLNALEIGITASVLPGARVRLPPRYVTIR